jgi:TonB family protein
MNRARSSLGLSLAWALGLMVLVPAICWPQSQDERAVRAAYVFNLAKFVEWPAETNELRVGFYGSSETGEFLRKMLDGRSSESRQIHMILFPSDDELQKCSIVYIADSQKKKVRATLDKLGYRNIVTVGETDWFAQDGGMVGLVKVGEQIQMQVNLEATQRAGVKMGSHLLNLAVLVRSGPLAASEDGERKVVQRDDPEYPAIAAKMSLHGTVKLKVRIAPDGTVRSAECVGGHPLLAESALKAVRKWRYEVKAKESTQVVDVNF